MEARRVGAQGLMWTGEDQITETRLTCIVAHGVSGNDMMLAGLWGLETIRRLFMSCNYKSQGGLVF